MFCRFRNARLFYRFRADEVRLTKALDIEQEKKSEKMERTAAPAEVGDETCGSSEPTLAAGADAEVGVAEGRFVATMPAARGRPLFRAADWPVRPVPPSGGAWGGG